MKRNYNRRDFLKYTSVAGMSLGWIQAAAASAAENRVPAACPQSAMKQTTDAVETPAATTPLLAETGKRVGIIGLDTSHSTAFVGALNAATPDPVYGGYRVVAAYPRGSLDIVSSTERVPAYTEEVKKAGVEIVGSIEELLSRVDVILLETNDGRPHLEQAMLVIKAGKPFFVDKPVAGSLADTLALYDAAKKHKVPVFSASSLRYTPGAQDIGHGKTLGKVLGADTWSPAPLEPHHPDFFWYGIHGIESLFTVMGTGCKKLTRIYTEDTDIVVGIWEDGRTGTFCGTRTGQHDYGGTAFGEKGVAPIGPYAGYEGLLKQIIGFFQTGIAPVSPEETIEIYTFMEAADESRRKGGQTIELAQTLKEARAKMR